MAKKNSKNPYDAMAWSPDPAVREIYSEIDDRDLSEIAEAIVFLESEFREPKATDRLSKKEAADASVLASQIYDWANYAMAYGDFSNPPWEKYGPKAQIEQALDALPDWQKPQAYLRSTEHYDVSAEGETEEDWVEEAAEGGGYEPYLVGINTGGYTGATVAVLAGHPDEALETASEWTQTYYYDSDPDAYEEAISSGYGLVNVESLFEAAQRGKNPSAKALKNKLLK